VIDHIMTGGEVLTTFFSVLIGAFALGQAGPSMEAISNGQGAAYQIFQTIDTPSEIDLVSREGDVPSGLEGNIKFSKVAFRYPNRPEAQIFEHLNLKIKPGQTVALVGPSGAGKSTVMQLLQRFYDPESGEVLLDGRNIKSLNIKWLRQQIGLVSQEPVLFSGTIAENIAWGKENASHEEIEAAARAANAYDFVTSFPDGFNTQVGEKGTQLSGGQKQRIAIARAIVKNPKILLLDEATSALDTESEKIVQDALDSVKTGRTTIVIAHRLSTIKDADVIAVVNKGGIAEKGTHDELMAKDGIYAGMVRVQSVGGVQKKKKHHKKTKGDTEAKDSAEKTVKTAVKDADSQKKHSVPFSRILKLNRPESVYIFIGCVGAAFNGVSNPIFSIVFSEMVTLYYKPGTRLETNPDGGRYSLWQ